MSDVSTVHAIRRYPVKAMGGEPLDSVWLDDRGLVGDRWYAVVDADGRLAAGKDSDRFRRRDTVFDYRARTADDGTVSVTDGSQTWTVGDPELDAQLSAVMDAAVSVRAEHDVPHQDRGQVSIIGTATLRWCAQRWGGAADARRLRTNLVIDTDEPFHEESWIGHTVPLGSAQLTVVQRNRRCRVIDVAQDGVRPEARWLRPATAERDMSLAVYATVTQPGLITVGH